MKNKKSLIIGIMCAVLIVMGVGYAFFSTNLNIESTGTVTGNFKVVMTNVSVSTTTYPNMGTGNYSGNLPATEVDLNATLYKPLDYVEYVVTVQNQGTMKAKYKGILNNENNEIINVTSTDLKDTNEDEVTILDPNETATFTVRIEMDRDVTTLPTKGTSYSFTLNPQFEQVTNTQEIIPPTDELNWYTKTDIDPNSGETGTLAVGIDDNYLIKKCLIKVSGNIVFDSNLNMQGVAYDSTIHSEIENPYSEMGVIPNDGDYIFIVNSRLIHSIIQGNHLYFPFDIDGNESDDLLELDLDTNFTP